MQYLVRKDVGDDHIEWCVDHLFEHRGGVVAQVIEDKIIKVYARPTIDNFYNFDFHFNC